jgi:hypothetical protein
MGGEGKPALVETNSTLRRHLAAIGIDEDGDGMAVLRHRGRVTERE